MELNDLDVGIVIIDPFTMFLDMDDTKPDPGDFWTFFKVLKSTPVCSKNCYTRS